jgi:hypothetical protein
VVVVKVVGPVRVEVEVMVVGPIIVVVIVDPEIVVTMIPGRVVVICASVPSKDTTFIVTV